MTQEQITLSISGFAFLVSIFSLILAYNAIKIEKKREKIELEKGKTALLNLTSNYFILNLQRTDFIGTTFNVKTDPNFTLNYVEGLEIIASQFDDLMTSSYYTELYKKYPMIGIMSVFIRKEIMFIKINKLKGQPYGFDNGVWERMFSTFEILRKEVNIEINEYTKILDNEIYKNAKSINEFLIKKNAP